MSLPVIRPILFLRYGKPMMWPMVVGGWVVAEGKMKSKQKKYLQNKMGSLVVVAINKEFSHC